MRNVINLYLLYIPLTTGTVSGDCDLESKCVVCCKHFFLITLSTGILLLVREVNWSYLPGNREINKHPDSL